MQVTILYRQPTLLRLALRGAVSALAMTVGLCLPASLTAQSGGGDLQVTAKHVRQDLSTLRRICRMVEEREWGLVSKRTELFFKEHGIDSYDSAPNRFGSKLDSSDPVQRATVDLLDIGGFIVMEDAAVHGQGSDAHVRALDEERRGIVEEGFPAATRGLYTLAHRLASTGNYAGAYQFHDCSLRLVHETYGPFDPTYVRGLGESAIVAGKLGDKILMKSSIDRAWSIANRIRHRGPDLRASVLADRGVAQEELGDTYGAEKTYHRALDILGRTGEYDSGTARIVRERLAALSGASGPRK